jgi:hypothetical protein
MLGVSVLASTLHDQRLGALGSALRCARSVEIDVAVFCSTGRRRCDW